MKVRTGPAVFVSAALATHLAAAPAWAQRPRLDLSPPDVAQAEPGSGDVEARLDFLTSRLAASEFEGDLWYYGWLGLYGIGLVTRTVEASTTDDDDTRLAAIVRLGKTAIGTTQMLLDPLPTRLGADPIRAMPDATPAQRRTKLRAAESLLARNAEYANRKYELWPHLSNALINIGAGGIIWAFGDWEDAAISTGVGLAFGEARLLTIPGGPIESLDAYEARFGSVADVGWSVVPRANGAALVYRF